MLLPRRCVPRASSDGSLYRYTVDFVIPSAKSRKLSVDPSDLDSPDVIGCA
jgi:hypothetical protein